MLSTSVQELQYVDQNFKEADGYNREPAASALEILGTSSSTMIFSPGTNPELNREGARIKPSSKHLLWSFPVMLKWSHIAV
jgi:hypothetical protein